MEKRRNKIMNFNRFVFFLALAALIFLGYSFLKLPQSMYFEFGTRQIGLLALLLAIICQCLTFFKENIAFILLSALFYFLSSLISPLIGMTLTAFALIIAKNMHSAELKNRYLQNKISK